MSFTKSTVVMGLLLLIGLVGIAQAQSSQTKITRIEVDQEEVKTSYKVLFLLNGNWIEAENTASGFIAPPELKGQEKLTIRFIFGESDLEFSELHRSSLETDWIVGVDLEPYADEFVKPDETEGLIGVYYLQFDEWGTQLVVTTRSAAK